MDEEEKWIQEDISIPQPYKEPQQFKQRHFYRPRVTHYTMLPWQPKALQSSPTISSLHENKLNAQLLCIMKMMCFKDISMQQSSGRNIKYFAGRLFITYNFTWRENPLIDNEFALSWFFLMFFVSIDRKHIKNLNLGHQGA